MYAPRVASVLTFTAALATLGRAAADDRPTLSGSWSASALTESWSVSDWGAACGPKPAGRGAGGGSVQIREQGGELSIVGAGRAFSSAECWEQMPGLSRSSHSASGGGRFWRTRCTSAPNDPRRAAITTTLSATDSSISLSETGEYQFIIQDTTCRATVSRSRSFSLVRRDGEAPPPASASASAAPPASASAPPAASAVAPSKPAPRAPSRCAGAAGEPARLEVHPGKKLLRAGDRFTFRAVVTDAEGCATGTRPSWSILPGPLAGKATIDATGLLVIAADASEGKLEVNAAVGDKGVIVPVEIAGGANYDALLGAGGLNDAGEAEQAAVAVIAAGTIGGRTTVAEDLARERKIRFVAIVGGLSVALAFAALVIARRGRRRDDVDAEPPSSHGPPSSAPTSLRGSAGPADAPLNPPAARPVAIPVGVAPEMGPKGAPITRPAARGKICPTCGDRYEAEAEFCGKDATKLVLIN